MLPLPHLSPQPGLMEDLAGPVLHDLLSTFPHTRTSLSEVFGGEVREAPHLSHLRAIKYLANKPKHKTGYVSSSFL